MHPEWQFRPSPFWKQQYDLNLWSNLAGRQEDSARNAIRYQAPVIPCKTSLATDDTTSCTNIKTLITELHAKLRTTKLQFGNKYFNGQQLTHQPDASRRHCINTCHYYNQSATLLYIK